jgi:hypothetical protein
MSLARAVLVLLFCSGTAAAQAPSIEVERALLQRQQQSEQFSLQLRQSQSLLGLPAAERRKLDATYLRERQAQERLHDAQQAQAAQEAEAGRAGAAERFEREQRAQDSGLGVVRQAGSADYEVTPSWTPTLEPRRPVPWTPTLEPRRP